MLPEITRAGKDTRIAGIARGVSIAAALGAVWWAHAGWKATTAPEQVSCFGVTLVSALLCIQTLGRGMGSRRLSAPATAPTNEKVMAKAMENAVYGNAGANMLAVKALIQQLIGLGIIALLVMKTLLVFAPDLDLFKQTDLEAVLKHKTYLAVVGTGLSVSAGIELAYMLFTPGPDEAIEPLILGLAGGVLISVSGKDIRLGDAAGLVALMVVLFGLRAFAKWQDKPDEASDPE